VLLLGDVSINFALTIDAIVCPTDELRDRLTNFLKSTQQHNKKLSRVQISNLDSLAHKVNLVMSISPSSFLYCFYSRMHAIGELIKELFGNILPGLRDRTLIALLRMIFLKAYSRIIRSCNPFLLYFPDRQINL
jgi:hypothetical protein